MAILYDGPISEMPEQYRDPQRDKWIPKDKKNVIVSEGITTTKGNFNRIFYNNKVATGDLLKDINRVVSRLCDKYGFGIEEEEEETDERNKRTT